MAEVDNLSANSAEELEALRIKYLSKKGAINDLMADFRNVPAEQKKEVGMRLNALKTRATERIAELKEAFETNDSGAAEMDLTRTAYPVELGTRHPLSIVKNEIIDIFARMGFALADGPEVEDDWHVFSSMNFAEDHPARDMQDTFFIEAHPDTGLFGEAFGCGFLQSAKGYSSENSLSGKGEHYVELKLFSERQRQNEERESGSLCPYVRYAASHTEVSL